MELIDLWYILVRRVWLIAILFIVSIGLTIGYLYYTPPIYESYAKLLVLGNKGGNFIDATKDRNDVLLQSIGRSDPLKTQIEILYTKPVLEKTIEKVGIIDAEGHPLSVVAFQKSVIASPISGTNIFTIGYRCNNAQDAAVIVNTLTEVFLNQSMSINQEEARIAREFVQKQLAIQKTKVSEAERAVLDFKRRTKTVSFAKETDAQISAISGLETDLKKIDTELKGAQAQKSVLDKNLANSQAKFSPFYNYWLSSLEQIQTRITGLLAQRANIHTQLNQLQNDQIQQPPAEAELSTLQRNETIANQIYTNLLERFEEIKIQEATKIASVRVIENASIAEKPILPKKRKVVGIGLVFGLVIGIGLAFFLEYRRDTPASVKEIKEIMSNPVLGLVPFVKTKDHLFLKGNQNTIAAESIRHIYTNIKLKSFIKTEPTTLLVTSALQSEGKSTVAANIAMACSNTSRKTALISLDLRRPSFDTIFGRAFSKGIIDYFNGEASFEDILNFNKESNLWIINAGKTTVNPMQILASEKIKHFITLLRQRFDIIIIDSAPVLMSSETLEIAKHTDGILLTISMKDSSRGALKTVNELFKENNLTLLGLVINKYNKNQWQNYGYYGNYGYGIPKISQQDSSASQNIS